MANVGIIVPITRVRPHEILSIPKDDIIMTADPGAGGKGVIVKIQFTIPQATFTQSIPTPANPLPDDKAFLQFVSGNQIETFFVPSVNKAELPSAVTTKLVAFELDFELTGKIGGAGPLAQNVDKDSM